MVSWEANFFRWQFFCFHLLKEGGGSWPFEQRKAVLLKIFITVELVFLQSMGTEVSASWPDGRSLADSVMGKFRPPGRRLQTSCQKGVILSQVRSTQSVAEMTESVDTDIYFPEFSSLAEWTLAEVSRGKAKKMSRWQHPKFCPSSPVKRVRVPPQCQFSLDRKEFVYE